MDRLIDSVFAFKQTETASDSVQSFIDVALSRDAGSSAEWYIFALTQSKNKYDYSAYQSSLADFLSINTIRNAVTRQRIALALLATGCKNTFVAQTANDSIGQQGIMSFVFGLHLLNNNIVCESLTTEQVIAKLLDLRLSDGGWAITGSSMSADTDVTAMVLQALSPHYIKALSTDFDIYPNLISAVDTAVSMLSDRQLEDGDFSGFGIRNLESTAQVMLALTSLNINCLEDSRFIKNGFTLLDGIRKYSLGDGSFCHEIGGEYNSTATVQALCALISLRRCSQGCDPFFVFGAAASNTATPSDTPTPSESSDSSAASVYKLVAYAIIAFTVLIICLALFLLKKRHRNNFLTVIIAGAALALFIAAADFKTPDEYYGSTRQNIGESIGTVTLSIKCDTIAGLSDADYIPEDGIILAATDFDIYDGDTAYDVLTEAAKQHRIQLEHSGSVIGSDNLVYISGINYIYEFAFGDLSGWLYRVNGASPSEGCGTYLLSDGDTIEWLYTLEMGRDFPSLSSPDNNISVSGGSK